MGSFLLILAGALCVFTAILHSVLGEKRLIAPLLGSTANAMKTELSRKVLRFAWHWTSVLWILVGAVLVSAGTGSFVDQMILLVIALAHIVVGLLDAVYTKGKHVGWPLITLIGVLTLFALFFE